MVVTVCVAIELPAKALTSEDQSLTKQYLAGVEALAGLGCIG